MIYTMTLIRVNKEPSRRDLDYKFSEYPFDTRCVGYHLNKKDSIATVTCSASLLSEEGYYKYCVIESRCEGAYSMYSSNTQYWYRWNKEKNSYVKCKKPRMFNNIISFGIG